jgi:hypothetical protein
MPKCKNDPKASFLGSEPSPKGRGICAHAEKAGSTRMGKDGRKWTVATRKPNNQKYWKPTAKKKAAPKTVVGAIVEKKPTAKKKAAPKTVVGVIVEKKPAAGPEIDFLAGLIESYWPGQSADLTHLDKWVDREPDADTRRNFKKLLGPVRKELEGLGVTVVIIPMRLDPKIKAYWSDWATHTMEEGYKKANGGADVWDRGVAYMGFEIRLGMAGGRPEADSIHSNEVMITHNIPKTMRAKVTEVMKHFGDNFLWDGSKRSKMAVLA